MVLLYVLLSDESVEMMILKKCYHCCCNEQFETNFGDDRWMDGRVQIIVM